jgi:CheY-like chemotaxis protein
LKNFEKMRKAHVLLVEDSEGDILLTKEGFNESKVQPTLSVVMDGWEAMQFLQKKGKYPHVSTPDLVLLDINLPKMNGQDVLKAVKSNPDTKYIPVVILTTSSHETDILQSYVNQANCFITKPIDVNDFIGVIGSISDFWLRLTKLPISN